MKFSVKTIVFTAVFAALCCVATMVIIVPLPNGYVNLGDVFVLLSGWCLGPCFGPIAAGIGSMIADIVSGYAMYAPVTFAVKALVSLCAYLVWYLFRSIIKNNKLDFLSRLISAIVGEIVMVFGYFLYESILCIPKAILKPRDAIINNTNNILLPFKKQNKTVNITMGI